MKGWQAPPGAVYVGRPSKWGNPFRVGGWYRLVQTDAGLPDAGLPGAGLKVEHARRQTDRTFAQVPNNVIACQLYRHWLSEEIKARARVELAGKNLMCWCPLEESCHADVLLELANSL